jgi:hypothetical protein
LGIISIPVLFRQPPCEAIPGSASELCRKAGVNYVTLCRPLPYGPHAAPLERGWQNPRKRYGDLPRSHAGQRRDVGPVGRVSSVTPCPVRPSPPLCHHPEHCNIIPGTVGAQDDKTSPHPQLCTLRPSVSCTLESAYKRRPKREVATQPPSKPLLDGYRTRHDTRWEQDSPGQRSAPRRCTPYHHT